MPTWRIVTGKLRALPRYEYVEPLNCFNPMDEHMNAIPSELLQLEAYSVSGLLTLERLYRLGQDVVARDVQGDFVECGVYNGGSAAAMACAFRSSNRRLWLYDSFQGMSATQAVDGELASRYVGELVGDEARVRKALAVASFPESRCVIRKGWFVDTLQLPLPEKVAQLHVDADWYDNVTLILETFYDRVSDGGVIILDDFGHWEGCREAFYDFVRGRGLKPLLERSGHTQAFWIKGRGHNRDFSGKKTIP